MAKKNNDLTLKVGFDIDKFQAEMNKTTSVLNKWSAGVQNSIMGVAAGFSALAIGQFVLDVSELAGKADGVRQAFEKLPLSIKLMQDLKHATMNAVSEFELMQRAVQANNFGISLEKLPAMLEFATTRAKQTGQSIDYLVDSLVTGLGRKSVLILDNLGIAASEISEEVKKVGDFSIAVGNIIEREVAKQGHAVETAATKVAQLGASWINLKVAIGDVANGTGVLGTAIDALTKRMDLLASRNLSFLDKLMAMVNPMYALNAATKDAAINAKQLSDQQKHQAEITDTASILLRDLGLDYEALMNVAGDNVNVMEIWAEMQRLAAERSKVVTENVVKETKAIKDLNKAAAEDAFAMAMNPDLGGLQDIASKFNVEDAMSGLVMPDAEDTDQTPLLSTKTKKDLEEVTMLWEDFGNTALNAISNVIAADQDLGKSLANITASVLAGSSKRISAFLGEGIAKAFSINPIAGAAIAATGLAVIIGLLGKVGARSNGGGGGGGGRSSSTSLGSRTESLGQRIELELAFTGDAGKVLKAQMIKQDRIDGRTRS